MIIHKYLSFIASIAMVLFCANCANEMTNENKTQRMCNRNLIETLNPTDLHFLYFKIHPPSFKLRYHCPKIKASCCTDGELERLVANWKENQKFVKYFKIQLLELYDYLDMIKFEHLQSKIDDKENCNYFDGKELLSYIERLKTDKDSVIKSLDGYLEYYNNHLIGAVCSICNADLNRYFNTIKLESEDENYLKIDIAKNSCRKLFKALDGVLPLVNFIFSYISIVKQISCINKYELEFIYEIHDGFKKDREDDINHCLKLDIQTLAADATCSNICIAVHNPVYLYDIYNILLLLDTSHLVMNERLGDISPLDEELQTMSELDNFFNFYRLSKKPFYQKIEENLKGQVLDEGGIDYLAQEGKNIGILSVIFCAVFIYSTS